MTDYEYAQAVMKAAGVPAGHWKMHQTQVAFHDDYPDPLTSGDAFLALWDALEAKGYLVDFDSNRNPSGSRIETCTTVWSLEERNEAFWSSQPSTDRKAALVQAAGQALGVSRAA